MNYMKIKDTSRRNFIKQNSFVGMGLTLFLGELGKNITGCTSAHVNKNQLFQKNQITHIGDMTLEQLRDNYHTELFDHFLPNMDRLVVDHKFGGFMSSVDIKLWKRVSSNKRAWNEGRGIWIYSYLYNNLKKNTGYLEIPQKSKDFILKQMPSDDGFWVASYTREGLPLTGPGDIFGNLYIAEGLTEFAKATGEHQYLELAKKITLSAMKRYDASDYSYSAEKQITGPRLLNHWMIFLHNCSQILRYQADPEIEQVAERCVDAIMNRHLNPEYHLLNQTLTHNLAPISDPAYSQSASLGLGIQALWMVLFEAGRKKDSQLFQRAAELFKRHVLVAHDPVYGGYFNALDQVDNYSFNLGKVQSTHMEVLNGALILIEESGDLWADKYFADTYAYIRQKFVRPEYAFAVESGDRRVNDHSTGMGTYHYPRNLAMTLVALNRMIKNKATALS